MALTPIIKGMADGAEAIQANFTAIGEIEKGTNANGTYIKFPDGTMICYGRVSISSLAIKSPWGASYLSPALSVTFPATFVEAPPAIAPNMENTTGDIATWYNVLASKNSFDGYFGSAVSRTFACTLSWMAIGRWK